MIKHDRNIDHTIAQFKYHKLLLTKTIRGSVLDRMTDLVTPYEFDHLVSSLSPLQLETAGSEDWVGQAGVVERLR